MISREDVALALETAYGDSYSPEGRAQHEHAADAILALIQPEVRELNAAWLRHTWPCGHISEGTGDEPDRCRICVAEERARKAEGERDNWKECITDEMAENVKLFDLLGVMPEIEAGRASTDAVVDAIQKLKADLATTQAALRAVREALELLLRPAQGRYREGDPPERSIPVAHHVADLLQASRAWVGTEPSVPVGDAVVEAAEFLVMLPVGGPSEEATERYEALVRAVHALRATEGRG